MFLSSTKHFRLRLAIVAISLSGLSFAVAQPGMDRMWGAQGGSGARQADPRKAFFDEGNYGMFIHWGLFSHHESQWKGKTFYGIGEWMLRTAKIPVKEYMESAKEFNPTAFDAAEIVRTAKAAGMKWIIITAKHHEGFAMFRSKHPFNIVDATPYAKDPMKELAEETRKAGLKFGFYYSHFQDWTAPGGNGGPTKTAADEPATFEAYFREKCYPQVEELCTQYGELSFMWFDTPGNMSKELVTELAQMVKKKQPKALLGSRIGHDFGDYDTLGDMQIPATNEKGYWETVDTTNDFWGYSHFDENWKSPATILRRLVSVVGRGGSYLLNIGPDKLGKIPVEAKRSLVEAGHWIAAHPQVIYGAGASPWQQAMPWGDVTTAGNILNAVVFDWPQDRKIHFPGIQEKPTKVMMSRPDGSKVELPSKISDGWLVIDGEGKIDSAITGELATLIELEFASAPEISPVLGVLPNCTSILRPEFSECSGVSKQNDRWMEKFGEWKHIVSLGDWKSDNAVKWNVEVARPGRYQLIIRHRGAGKAVWEIKTDEGDTLLNQIGAGSRYHEEVLGQLQFFKPGKHAISLALREGERDAMKLELVKLTPVK